MHTFTPTVTFEPVNPMPYSFKSYDSRRETRWDLFSWAQSSCVFLELFIFSECILGWRGGGSVLVYLESQDWRVFPTMRPATSASGELLKRVAELRSTLDHCEITSVPYVRVFEFAAVSHVTNEHLCDNQGSCGNERAE